MRRFSYYEPQSLSEAAALLEKYGDKASLLAGGTDLLVEVKEKLRQPDHVINLKKIPGLAHLCFDDKDGLRFGTLTTVRAVETDPAIIAHYAGLQQAALELGSIQIRNRATVVGNICRASPSADTLPPLIADGTRLRIFGKQGERVVSMEDFFTGPGRTILETGEIVTEVLVPPPPVHCGKAYIKHGRRQAMELATVGVAVHLVQEGDICREARIVLGAVAPTPIRAPEAEEHLRGAVLDEATMAEAARLAKEIARPISDVRSSASYRRAMVEVLTARAISQAAQRAQNGPAPGERK
ncbi:MAG: FAD binding domain-containing protein [Chloroflexota bacterium]